MSGGSYDYIAYKDPDDLFDHERMIEHMADRLAGLGYAEDAARETHELLLLLRQARIRLKTRHDRLSPVWHAVEWWDSQDSGERAVIDALAEYRGK